jgi:hypothetical protein
MKQWLHSQIRITVVWRYCRWTASQGSWVRYRPLHAVLTISLRPILIFLSTPWSPNGLPPLGFGLKFRVYLVLISPMLRLETLLLHGELISRNQSCNLRDTACSISIGRVLLHCASCTNICPFLSVRPNACCDFRQRETKLKRIAADVRPVS